MNRSRLNFLINWMEPGIRQSLMAAIFIKLYPVSLDTPNKRGFHTVFTLITSLSVNIVFIFCNVASREGDFMVNLTLRSKLSH